MSVSEKGGLRAFTLMAFAVLILVLPGFLFNNLNASGLIVPQTCNAQNATAGDPNCVGNLPTGCQNVPAQCTLNGQSLQWLSASSPFTIILKGGIFAYWTALTSSGPSTSGSAAQGPFDPLSSSGTGGQYFVANCGKGAGITNSIRFWIIDGCTQINAIGRQNTSEVNATRLSNWNTGANQCNCVRTSPFLGLQFGPNGTSYNFNCALIGGGTSVTGFGSSNSSNALNGFTYFGCDLYKGNNPETAADPWMSAVLSIPNTASNGTVAGSYHHFTAYFEPVTWEAYFCGLYGQQPSLYQDRGSSQCLQFFQTINRVPNGGGSSTLNFGLLTPILSFIIGLILVIIGIGLRISASGSIFGTGTGFTAATNDQGTKLAQVIGFGLLIWTPLFSEFGSGSWIASQWLPNGLDIVVGFLLTAMFGAGLVWQLWSYL